jgi:tRNA (guanine10-N2)-dimethyltransferase
MEIALLLSKEHSTLPRAEVDAVMDCEGVKYHLKMEQEGLLILDIPHKNPEDLERVIERLSYTHEVFQILLQVDENDLLTEAEKYPWDEIVSSSYAVRVKKMDKKSKLNTSKLEWDLGGIIKSRVSDHVRVNLENPSTFLRVVLKDGQAIAGNQIGKISKKHFFNLKPHKRPFFYPGSMSPKLARCMVNLTRIKKGQALLDPFCGTGGILIEAGMVGARVIGTDIDYKMVNGTKKNLEHCGISNYQVFQEDARKLELPHKVDAIVTDPPYGISASTRGEKSHDLYHQAMKSLQGLIKEDGLLCLATPHYLDLDEILAGTKFKIIEQHHIRMHKSLTRVISLLSLV